MIDMIKWLTRIFEHKYKSYGDNIFDPKHWKFEIKQFKNNKFWKHCSNIKN